MEGSKPLLDFELSKLVAAFGVLAAVAGVLAMAPVLVVVGVIAWLIGVYYLSLHYGRRGIFDYALYSGVAGMLAGVIAAAALVGSLLAGAFVFSLVIALVVFWIVMIISAVYLRKHTRELAAASPSDALERAGRYVYLGSILAIIIVGLVIILIGLVFLVLGLLELKPPAAAPASPQAPQPGPPSA